MAAAARPNQADARIPCPLCGGLVHPLAGRCKHCKGELGNLRGATPAAAAALPALQHAAAPPQPPPAPVAIAPPPAAAYDPYARPAPAGNPYAPTPPPGYAPGPAGPVHAPPSPQGVLPPRPTGRQYVARRPAGWWKSWPVIVIIIAALAIVAAVVLMVWPPGGKEQNNRSNGNVPAPDRTPTNPLPRDRSSSNDRDPPRADPTPPPQTPQTPPPKSPIDIPDDPDPDVADPDPWTGAPAPPTPLSPTQDTTVMLSNIFFHACEHLRKCGTADTNSFGLLCRAYSKPPASPPRCPAAARCLERVAKIPCATDVADWMSFADSEDCMNALHC
ncbi:MAG: hypothetical protein KF773_35650 [Deltaproteobacteria bacterium]|nr:hypothetical protein [Deltaproteobacteria bacterium]